METEGEIAVGLRSDGVVYELHREASILRRGPRSAARANALRPARLPRSIAEIPRMPLGYRQIIIESLQILKTIERSGGGSGRLAVSSFITRGASDGDGANDVPWALPFCQMLR